MIIIVDWINNSNVISVEQEGEKLCRPKRGCVVHNNTEHHGTNVDHLLSCMSVEEVVI